MPKLTVLMPVYNGEVFLKESIESVLNQTFSDYEFLIIDDKSSDNSKGIILSYNDRRIRFVENSHNLGQMATLNKGVEISRGEYIARMDQDDTSLPERFKEEIELLENCADVGLVYSDTLFMDENGNVKDRTLFDYVKPHRQFVFDKLLKENIIVGNTVMMRKSVFDNIGLYNPSYNIAAEYDLYLRLTRRYKVDFVNKPLARYRLHSENATRNREKLVNEVVEILTNLCHGLDGERRRIARRAILRYKTELLMTRLLPGKVMDYFSSLRGGKSCFSQQTSR